MIKFEVVKGNILDQNVDVIVTTANQSLNGGGGDIDGIIHSACGEDLMAECKEIGGCSTGTVKLTMSYDLEEKGVGWIIHAVGPRYAGGMYFEADLLADVYKAALGITIDYRKFYKEQCIGVLNKYVGHLDEVSKKPYVKDTLSEVYAYCDDFPIKSIAFPSISTHEYGYPLDEASVIAVRAIRKFCRDNSHLERVVLVCNDKKTYEAYKNL